MQNTVEVFFHFAQQIDVHNAIKELKTDPSDGDSPRFASRQNDRQEDRTGRQPTWPLPRADFAAGQLRRLSRLVDEADLVECEEEGRIAYITTWYLHHSEHKTCRDSRPVRLSDHPEEWKAQIIEAWQDVVRLDQSLSLSLVTPQPPCSDLECTQAHVLIEQGQQPDQVGFVISVIDEACTDQRREQIMHSAHSDEAMQTRGSIIHLARLQTLQPQGQCRVTWKQFPFAIHDPEILESATNVVIQLPRNDVAVRDEVFSLMQSELILQPASTTQNSSHQSGSQCAVDINHSAPPSEAIAFQFNLNAAPFQPGQANLFGANEFVIDLFAQWNQHAAVWDEEMPSCTIETWFVDHRWQNPHCRNSRQKQLFANYWQWEDELRRLWIEYVDARSNIDFYVVHPKPPSGTNAVAAHVILVQQEREDWVTSLVSVYEARPDRPSLHYNIAVTTHEHILVDNLLRVVGHETHCLATIPSHGFAAWYLQIQLHRGQPLAGRSGYGISLQIWQFRLADYLPHTAELLEAQHGPTLLQTKAQRRTICIEEALVDDSEQDQKSDEGPSYAVRLRAGDLTVQVPSFLEIDGVPTESKIVDELKHWGHDCYVFQFAGHHEFLCLSRDRIHDDSVRHYIFGSTDGTDPNAAFLHSHKGDVLNELDCMKILHSLGYFKTTIQAIIQCLPDVYKVVFVPQMSILDPGSLQLRPPTPWPDRTPAELRTQPRPNFCCEDLPVECGPCKLSLGVDVATLASFFSQEEFPLCTTFEGLQLPPSTAMAPFFDWSTSEVVRIASGAYKGHHGTELWISLKQPYAYVLGKPQFFHRRHFTVRHADPRTLLVSIDAPFLNALVLVGHGPQSGQPLSDREQWWHFCGELCTRQRACDSQYLFALLDANAAAGVRDDILVGPHEDAPSASTPMLRAFLEEQELCLPATFSTHVGKHSTWTSPSGELQCRIDHVVIPQSLRSKCEFSIVDENFDLGLTHIDHELVGVQLHWQGCSQQSLQTAHQKQGFERADLSRLSLQTDMKDYKVPCWAHNIEQHVDHFNEFVITAMEKTHPSRKRGPKKPYLDEKTWALRTLKLRHRKTLREIHRRQKIELLFQIWRAWTRQIGDQQQVDSVRCYSATLACCSVRCMAQLHNVAQQLKVRLCKAKAHLLQSRLEQLPGEASAGQILQAIHKIQGPTNPKKIKRRPFPLLKNDDGTHCASGSQRSDRWAEFFCNMEGGRRLSHHELREGWIDNLKHFRQHQFDLNLEVSYSHVRIGRAVGMDSIPPEACKYNAGQFARATFSQLLKMTLHGQEAIPHKGGRLTAAYKGKGDVDDCASYRSLLEAWDASLVPRSQEVKDLTFRCQKKYPCQRLSDLTLDRSKQRRL
ncbi:unnamed protein product [Cladocopium goreaui]|uniref:CSD domain-containing protein n=1 Tax=Cladocopium goreaui TaxID=2562237 RepID=A0A9P1GBJ2_9DINO|nr:unnamed protein product [Cladocopium goreaui]